MIAVEEPLKRTFQVCNFAFSLFSYSFFFYAASDLSFNLSHKTSKYSSFYFLSFFSVYKVKIFVPYSYYLLLCFGDVCCVTVTSVFAIEFDPVNLY